jgi:FMN phosphatase YigB (HAD superfamily)
VQRLVLFDLDDTLVDQAGAFSQWAAGFAATYALPADAVSWLIAANHRITGPKDRLFTAIRRHFGLTPSIEVLWAQYRARMPELVQLRPHVLDGLAALRAHGWRLGIVTNGMPDNQIAKIERTGLAAHVDGYCVSGDIGVRKPDPRIFGIAAERCGSSLEAGGWIIGDSPTLDVDGGRCAGLNTYWISHKRQWPADQPPPDRTAHDTHIAMQKLLTSPTPG